MAFGPFPTLLRSWRWKRAVRRTTSGVKPQPAAEQAASTRAGVNEGGARSSQPAAPGLAATREARARRLPSCAGLRPPRGRPTHALIRPRDRKRSYHLHPTVPV
ncbi:hypothetical protein MTO96_011925 [Rhipicephalus appendiculatus]